MTIKSFIAATILIGSFTAGADTGNAASMPVKSLENTATVSVLKHKLRQMRDDRERSMMDRIANKGGSCDLNIGAGDPRMASLLPSRHDQTIIILGSVIKLDGGSAQCTGY